MVTPAALSAGEKALNSAHEQASQKALGGLEVVAGATADGMAHYERTVIGDQDALWAVHASCERSLPHAVVTSDKLSCVLGSSEQVAAADDCKRKRPSEPEMTEARAAAINSAAPSCLMVLNGDEEAEQRGRERSSTDGRPRSANAKDCTQAVLREGCLRLNKQGPQMKAAGPLVGGSLGLCSTAGLLFDRKEEAGAESTQIGTVCCWL